jgi:hypothetical protein
MPHLITKTVRSCNHLAWVWLAPLRKSKIVDLFLRGCCHAILYMNFLASFQVNVWLMLWRALLDSFPWIIQWTSPCIVIWLLCLVTKAVWQLNHTNWVWLATVQRVFAEIWNCRFISELMLPWHQLTSFHWPCMPQVNSSHLWFIHDESWMHIWCFYCSCFDHLVVIYASWVFT